MVQTIQIEFSINSNTTSLKYKLMLTLGDMSKVCSMIQRLNSYNLLTDKVTEKVPYTIYRPDKKNKKSIGESEMNFP